MADYSLIPVDHQPEFADVSLVPVDYHPFSADGLTQQAQAPQVQAQTQLAQTQPQQPATTIGQPYVGAPSSDTPTTASSDPVKPNGPPSAPIFSPGTPAPANPQQPGDASAPGPASDVRELIGARIAELGNDFYNQSIRKPIRDLRDMGHDLITDPAYFFHAIGPSLVGLGMSAPAARVGPVGLAERAKEIHNVLDGIAQRMRTTAVLETDAGRIIAGGTKDLSLAQRAALGRGEIAAKARGIHAEVTALNKAANIGATPTELAVTRTICPECAAFIESLGGKLTSPTTAFFPRR